MANSSFSSLGLSDHLLESISQLGYVEPTEIQSKVIPHVLTSHQDLVALAPTGTGKTAAFGLPLLQEIWADDEHVRALIICPTRELAIQIESDIKSYRSKKNVVKSLVVYGGTSVSAHRKELKKKNQIVVGTPGRVLDLIRRKSLKVGHIKYLVLDEADEMLNMGFKEDLDAILSDTPSDKRTLLFSATMPRGVREIAQNYLNYPLEIVAGGRRNMAAANITHKYVTIAARKKPEALLHILLTIDEPYGIVFCRTRGDTKTMSRYLNKYGFQSQFINGDLTQSQRESVLDGFKKKEFDLLVATDVAARGLDVNKLSHVINYNLPDDLEVYVHRSGRTGRAGNKGECISIFNKREARRLRSLEKIIGSPIHPLDVLSQDSFMQKKMRDLLQDVITNGEKEVKNFSIPEDIRDVFMSMSKDEIVKVFLNNAMRKMKIHDLPNLDLKAEGRGKRGEERHKSEGMKAFFIGIGKGQGMSARDLMNIINKSTPGKKIDIGRIILNKNFSLFEMSDQMAHKIVPKMNELEFHGNRIFVKEVPQSELDGKSMHPKRDKKKRKFKKNTSGGKRRKYRK